jgi:hypothetical protein
VPLTPLGHAAHEVIVDSRGVGVLEQFFVEPLHVALELRGVSAKVLVAQATLVLVEDLELLDAVREWWQVYGEEQDLAQKTRGLRRRLGSPCAPSPREFRASPHNVGGR